MSFTVGFARSSVYSGILTIAVVIVPTVLVIGDVWTKSVWIATSFLLIWIGLLSLFVLVQGFFAQVLFSYTIHDHFLEHHLPSFAPPHNAKYDEITAVWRIPFVFHIVTTKHRFFAMELPSMILLDRSTQSQVRQTLQGLLSADHPLRAKWARC